MILSGPLASMDTLDPASGYARCRRLADRGIHDHPDIELPGDIEIENITPQAVPAKIEAYVPPTASPDSPS